MPLIRPFAGLRPAPGRAAEVIAPPYDVLSTEEARAKAAGKPWSFLHISKPEIDLPPGTNPHAPQVYAKAAENLQRMLRRLQVLAGGAFEIFELLDVVIVGIDDELSKSACLLTRRAAEGCAVGKSHRLRPAVGLLHLIGLRLPRTPAEHRR